MPPKKRAAKTLIGAGTKHSKSKTPAKKRAKTDSSSNPLKDEFTAIFSQPQYQHGISNTQLKIMFGERYSKLASPINELTRESRLSMHTVNGELLYILIGKEVAAKFAGLDVSTRMVYQLIERSGNKGIWTKHIKSETNIQTQPMNKILKNLETRKLIKPIKSVLNKSKKLFMLYDIVPSRELTGGPWYNEDEFDHEYVGEMRNFILMCVRRLNGGKGISTKEIASKVKEANVSREALSFADMQQLLQTLAFDYLIEHNGTNLNGEALFVAARKVTSVCEFRWWNVLDPDFHFRDIRFEDDLLLSRHEPHHHTD